MIIFLAISLFIIGGILCSYSTWSIFSYTTFPITLFIIGSIVILLGAIIFIERLFYNHYHKEKEDE